MSLENNELFKGIVIDWAEPLGKTTALNYLDDDGCVSWASDYCKKLEMFEIGEDDSHRMWEERQAEIRSSAKNIIEDM